MVFIIDKHVLKFIWKCRGPRIAKALFKVNNVIGLTQPARYQNITIVTRIYSILLYGGWFMEGVVLPCSGERTAIQ